jgi:chorismate dehydratase
MKKLNVTAVSYLNTKPFLYGLLKSRLENIKLELNIPSRCAEMLATGEADLGLVPVAVIPSLQNPHIISNYCIGCDGPVRTVCLFSEVPLEKIERVYLDFHSRTSVKLTEILFAQHWGRWPQFLPAQKGFEENIKGTTAGLIIGDRTIEYEKRFPYIYDLGEVWKKMTGLPFIFAAWVSNRPLEPAFVEQFNQALSMGLDYIPELMYLLPTPNSGFSAEEYFRKYISYDLDDRKKKALQLFFKYLKAGPFPGLFSSGNPKVEVSAGK